jgi:glycosyltransferase involved in cell wall biosynthesis
MEGSRPGSAGKEISGTPESGSLALVHDYLLVLRGAERTFQQITRCWPQSPVYTLLYDEQFTARAFPGTEIHASPLQRSRQRQKGFRRLLPFFARAAAMLPLDRYDVVVSSTAAFAHLVRPREDAVHVAYCHSPFRYAWHDRDIALREVPWFARLPLDVVLRRHRQNDLAAAGRITQFIASSRIGQERIARYWGRDAPIVHPPVETERFAIAEPQDYFLVVAELVRHKRVELALEAARLAGVPIKVVGTGPDLERLRALHGDHATFLGRVCDEDLAPIYASARAFVLPNVEEFGIAAVEAQAAGRPVIAAAAGGALETMIDGVTGVHVPPGDPRALAEAMRSVDFDRFSPKSIRANAQRFSVECFRERFPQAVGEVVQAHTGRAGHPAAEHAVGRVAPATAA